MSVTVSLEFTPNPDTLKYAVSIPLLERGALDFVDPSTAGDSPLAQKLFGVTGVKAVMIGRDFVTITIADQDLMMEANTAVIETLKQHLDAGEPVFTGELPASEHGAVDDEVSRKVVEILDAQIRPAVAMDGGDIVFDRFDAGIVYLQLKGSCSGCPSSMATLKHGIEQRLRMLVPEVAEVQAVAM
ncbi:MAG: NifU family protein [Planctomycetota bacterium]|nr:NifU family protein [Planctomycetota bacterium]